MLVWVLLYEEKLEGILRVGEVEVLENERSEGLEEEAIKIEI